ncbi:GntR family transcriptional regulator [Paracoccus sp. (in: a-proteobacteria)]|uniref:GntR family transcriptional regulator n=1 Tax=Paracoccus sp. TaxID=267 RepID=UPI0028B1A1F7|nr:GntR family transcriptional regulator [Paracoccus sp. (in: a-proteobacteria)]
MESGDDFPQGQLVYRQLLGDIRMGDLLPGMRLREVEISTRLGMSRTPVREAIRQLEADGLVVHIPRQGATIRTLDYPEIMELYEMRAVVEGTAARLASRAASAVELKALESLNDEFGGAADEREAATLNRQFHMMLLNAAKNRFLVSSVNSLQKAMLILGPTTLMERSRMADAYGEHRAILDALTARDGQRAETEMRAHIEAAQHVRLKSLRQYRATTEE